MTGSLERVVRSQVRWRFFSALIGPLLLACGALIGLAAIRGGAEDSPPWEVVASWLWHGVGKGSAADTVLDVVLTSLGAAIGLLAIHVFARSTGTSDADAVYDAWLRWSVSMLYLVGATAGWLLVVVCGIEPRTGWWASAGAVLVSFVCAAFAVLVWTDHRGFARRLAELDKQRRRLKKLQRRWHQQGQRNVPGWIAFGGRVAGYGPAAWLGVVTVVLDAVVLQFLGGWGLSAYVAILVSGLLAAGWMAVAIRIRCESNVRSVQLKISARRCALSGPHVLSLLGLGLYLFAVQDFALGYVGDGATLLHMVVLGVHAKRGFPSDRHVERRCLTSTLRMVKKERSRARKLEAAHRPREARALVRPAGISA